MFLRSQVLASSAGKPVEVQASFSDIGDNSVSVADIASLIEVIERRKARIAEEINALSTELLETQIDVILNPRYTGGNGSRLWGVGCRILAERGTKPRGSGVGQMKNVLGGQAVQDRW